MIMGATLLSRTPWRLHLDIGKSSPGSLPHISGGWARYGYRTRDIIYCAYAFSRKTFNLLGRGCSRLVCRRAHRVSSNKNLCDTRKLLQEVSIYCGSVSAQGLREGAH